MNTLFAIPLRRKPWPPGKHRVRPCPVCGKTWFPWAGSFLRCHARCLLAPEDRQIVRSDPRPLREIAEHYGVSMSVVLAIRRDD
jgi:hypothetical protein